MFHLINLKVGTFSSFFYRSPFPVGCVDPSEPFQCPRSEKCIALQFICDGNPGDCPGNTDENEETCIAGREYSSRLQSLDSSSSSQTTSERKY